MHGTRRRDHDVKRMGRRCVECKRRMSKFSRNILLYRLTFGISCEQYHTYMIRLVSKVLKLTMVQTVVLMTQFEQYHYPLRRLLSKSNWLGQVG